MGQMENEVYTICSEEIEAVIRDLPKGKACGSDNVSAELLQCMGEKGIQIMTRLINKIYKSALSLTVYLSPPCTVVALQKRCHYRRPFLLADLSSQLQSLRYRLYIPRSLFDPYQ